MERTKEMQETIDNISEKLFGKSLTNAQEGGVCVSCEREVKEFRNKLSLKEYSISGMCQECQDSIFGVD